MVKNMNEDELIALYQKVSIALNGNDAPTCMAIIGLLTERVLRAWPEDQREDLFDGTLRDQVFER